MHKKEIFDNNCHNSYLVQKITALRDRNTAEKPIQEHPALRNAQMDNIIVVTIGKPHINNEQLQFTTSQTVMYFCNEYMIQKFLQLFHNTNPKYYHDNDDIKKLL